MLNLLPVTEKHIEWLRTQRNRPELYKYFRQDKPITEIEQKRWWRNTPKNRMALFLVLDDKSEKVGYVGFNPLSRYARMAEFGTFILPEHQSKGYGRQAMELLLAKGFKEYNLATIYSDVLDYPGENRFAFYEGLGFVKHAVQDKGYVKQGVRVPSIKFYMTREMYEKRKPREGDNAKASNVKLEPGGQASATEQPAKRKRGRPRLHPSSGNVQKTSR